MEPNRPYMQTNYTLENYSSNVDDEVQKDLKRPRVETNVNHLYDRENKADDALDIDSANVNEEVHRNLKRPCIEINVDCTDDKKNKAIVEEKKIEDASISKIFSDTESSSEETIFKKTFQLSQNLAVSIERLNKNIIDKNFQLLPIQNSAFWEISNLNKDPLFLPKIYMALRSLTGVGETSYDNYKGSYRFSFVIDIEKNKHSSKYLYSLCHCRSYLDFFLWQYIPTTDTRNKQIMHQPKNELFSNEDICLFSNKFCQYLLQYIEKGDYSPREFVKCSVSNFILFGYHEGKYFSDEYQEEEEFIKAKSLLEEAIPPNED